MNISAKTDTGKVRNSNQDAYAYNMLTDDVAWAVVCDGMGGANGGNIASETAVKVVSNKIISGFHDGMNDNTIKHLLVSSVEAANASVYSVASKNEDLSGMGTTIVVTIVNKDTVYLANVGDSRIYIVNSESIRQITTDHSVVQMMVDKGEISPEEAREHPQKNVITRALGVDEDVKIDYSQEPLEENEIVLLCSDGLTNFVDNDTIKEICIKNDADKIADILVDKALDGGGGDNVTAVILKY